MAKRIGCAKIQQICYSLHPYRFNCIINLSLQYYLTLTGQAVSADVNAHQC